MLDDEGNVRRTDIIRTFTFTVKFNFDILQLAQLDCSERGMTECKVTPKFLAGSEECFVGTVCARD